VATSDSGVLADAVAAAAVAFVNAPHSEALQLALDVREDIMGELAMMPTGMPPTSDPSLSEGVSTTNKSSTAMMWDMHAFAEFVSAESSVNCSMVASDTVVIAEHISAEMFKQVARFEEDAGEQSGPSTGRDAPGCRVQQVAPQAGPPPLADTTPSMVSVASKGSNNATLAQEISAHVCLDGIDGTLPSVRSTVFSGTGVAQEPELLDNQAALAQQQLLTFQNSDEPHTQMEFLHMTIKVENVNYALLSTKPMLLDSFEHAMKAAIAAQAGNGVKSENIIMTLSAGSVVVNASVPLSGCSPHHSALEQKLQSAPFAASLQSSVASLAGIEEVSTGPICISKLVLSSHTDVTPPQTRELRPMEELANAGDEPNSCQLEIHNSQLFDSSTLPPQLKDIAAKNAPILHRPEDALSAQSADVHSCVDPVGEAELSSEVSAQTSYLQTWGKSDPIPDLVECTRSIAATSDGLACTVTASEPSMVQGVPCNRDPALGAMTLRESAVEYDQDIDASTASSVPTVVAGMHEAFALQQEHVPLAEQQHVGTPNFASTASSVLTSARSTGAGVPFGSKLLGLSSEAQDQSLAALEDDSHSLPVSTVTSIATEVEGTVVGLDSMVATTHLGQLGPLNRTTMAPSTRLASSVAATDEGAAASETSKQISVLQHSTPALDIAAAVLGSQPSSYVSADAGTCSVAASDTVVAAEAFTAAVALSAELAVAAESSHSRTASSTHPPVADRSADVGVPQLEESPQQRSSPEGNSSAGAMLTPSQESPVCAGHFGLKEVAGGSVGSSTIHCSMHPCDDIAEEVKAEAANEIVAQAMLENVGHPGLQETPQNEALSDSIDFGQITRGIALDVAEGVSQGSSCVLTNTLVSSNSWAQEIAAIGIDPAAFVGDRTSDSSPGEPSSCLRSMLRVNNSLQAADRPETVPQSCAPSTISEPVSVQALSENVDCGILVKSILSDVAEGAHSGNSCLMSRTCVSGQASYDGTRCLEQDLGEHAPVQRSYDPAGHQGVASTGGSTSTHGTECLSELLDIRRTQPGEERPSLLPAPRLVDIADVLAVAHETGDTELVESPRITSAYQLEACCTEAVQENSRLLDENEQLRRELDMVLAMTSHLGAPSSEGSTTPENAKR
jgi:hypothetical protein